MNRCGNREDDDLQDRLFLEANRVVRSDRRRWIGLRVPKFQVYPRAYVELSVNAEKKDIVQIFSHWRREVDK